VDDDAHDEHDHRLLVVEHADSQPVNDAVEDDGDPEGHQGLLGQSLGVDARATAPVGVLEAKLQSISLLIVARCLGVRVTRAIPLASSARTDARRRPIFVGARGLQVAQIVLIVVKLGLLALVAVTLELLHELEVVDPDLAHGLGRRVLLIMVRVPRHVDVLKNDLVHEEDDHEPGDEEDAGQGECMGLLLVHLSLHVLFTLLPLSSPLFEVAVVSVLVDLAQIGLILLRALREYVAECEGDEHAGREATH